MPIFKDNYFTNDSYSLRSSRLEIMKNYIEYWSIPLSIPKSLVGWGLSAYEKWQKAIEAVKENKGKANIFFEELKDAEEKTFKYYLRCKRLLLSKFSQNNYKLKSYGIDGKFPRNRVEKIKAVEKVIEANGRMIKKGDSDVLLEDFIIKLNSLLQTSMNIFEKTKTKSEDKTEVEKQVELFKEDSRKLRTLYAWALMTRSPEEPYLFQLGFAVKPKKSVQKEEGVKEKI
ncbi:MAG: hypothetical protein K8R49_08640 [Candidatus Cloacimonetes bacterium]|nr:hypothetical protein [Candidatus Cloacimonadota bacterium]